MSPDLHFDLLCLGGSSVDLVLRVPHLPDGDEKLLADLVGRLPGGLVANAACAAARLGLRTSWVGFLGDDEGARMLLADFARFGVDTSDAVQIPGFSSDFCVILLQPSGERSILVVNTLPGLPPFEGNLERILTQSAVVYTLPYSLDWFEDLASKVHAAGNRVAVDIESSAPLSGAQLHTALGCSDVIFCSQDGLALATGSRDPQTGANFLLGLGPELVVVTQGARGAWAITRQTSIFGPAFPVQPVDTTGAGDCFHAAFLSRFLQGEPLEACLSFANAAAAISVQQVGARAGLPTQAEVATFLKAVRGETGER
jgi:sugar/nucleoside kinase (ribokinase family)